VEVIKLYYIKNEIKLRVVRLKKRLIYRVEIRRLVNFNLTFKRTLSIY